MSNAALAWLEVLIAALLITIAGSRLSKYGDVIAEKTGVGGAWIGARLLCGASRR